MAEAGTVRSNPGEKEGEGVDKIDQRKRWGLPEGATDEDVALVSQAWDNLFVIPQDIPDSDWEEYFRLKSGEMPWWTFGSAREIPYVERLIDLVDYQRSELRRMLALRPSASGKKVLEACRHHVQHLKKDSNQAPGIKE